MIVVAERIRRAARVGLDSHGQGLMPGIMIHVVAETPAKHVTGMTAVAGE